MCSDSSSRDVLDKVPVWGARTGLLVPLQGVRWEGERRDGQGAHVLGENQNKKGTNVWRDSYLKYGMSCWIFPCGFSGEGIF